MQIRETASLEYKEAVSSSFLKTVSAFANYQAGRIVFGVNDQGYTVGLVDPVADCLRIENMVNDSITPTPPFSLGVDSSAATVTLSVREGRAKPYLYKGKAYRRGDSSTVEVDRIELGRLVLEGSNTTFDELPAAQQDLEFSVLETRLKTELGISELSGDVMRTLDLLGTDGFTNAAAILADENRFPGIDVVRFGASANELLDRATVERASAISQLEGALEMYERYYVSERIEGAERTRVEAVPAEAFREAVANAIVHRAWDVRANVSISMFPDRIEVVSPGSLPPGLSVAEYLDGRISVLRNPVLANVFFRLRYIEKFGTGVERIRAAYEGQLRKPTFSVMDETVSVVLPANGARPLGRDEASVLGAIPEGAAVTRADVEAAAGISKDKAVRVLNALVERGIVRREGTGRSTRYLRA